ncbi:MAG: hypothetical protein IT436_13795 [Phycisphaerales bacterium]|nr:hypothetical protein [Phycisphaerales bacterium]
MRTVLALWLALPSLLALLMAADAIVEWFPIGRESPFMPAWVLGGQLIVAVVGALAAVAAGAVGVRHAMQARGAAANGWWTWLMSCASPIAVQLLMPAEDPYTGAGWPAGSVLGACALCVPVGLLFVVPAILSARKASELKQRRV